MKNKFFLLGLCGIFLLNSCSSDDDYMQDENPITEDADYTNGILVVNEGSQSAGTITYISEDLQTSQQDLYANVNNGDDLGKYVQSIFFNDDLAYIISNGSNIITVVNRYTFELVGKIDSGLTTPVFGVVEDGKAYVSNLNDPIDGTDEFIAVINLETLEVEETIPMVQAYKMREANDKIYVQNASFGVGNLISVIDPATNTVQDTIGVANGLNDIEIEDGKLYALSSGKLQVIDLTTNEISSEVVFTEDLTGAKELDLENGQIYYTIGTAVYSIAENATEPAEEALLDYNTTSEYGVMYGFEVEDDKIYVADGGDFASNSFIEVYSLDGNLLKNISVGVGPNGFYFND